MLNVSTGGSSKTLVIVNVSPDASNVSETISSLNFASRARNAMLSLGNRDTIKKWRDIVCSVFPGGLNLGLGILFALVSMVYGHEPTLESFVYFSP